VLAAPRPVPRKASAIPLHPPAPEADPAVRAAEARYAEAMRAFEAGDRARARELFVAALGALPPVHVLRAQTLYNLDFLADGDMTDGKLRAACDAQAAYDRYLEVAPPEPEHAETRAMAQLARNAQADAESRAIYGDVAFGLAVALGGIAGWLWLSSRSPAAGEVDLSLTPGPGMLVLGGGF